MSKPISGRRIVVLDTETTGLDTRDGHRIIEVGCVEMVDRRLTGNNFHEYMQPDRAIDAGAQAVHGISNEFLQDKERFSDHAQVLRDYLSGAELIIHNAPFDVGFLAHEFELCGMPVTLVELPDSGDGNKKVEMRWAEGNSCIATDSLAMARKQFPGQKNNLDALCKRLGVNNGHRTLHGALLDSEILADVYLAMTGGQTDLLLDSDDKVSSESGQQAATFDASKLKVISATESEEQAHQTRLESLRKSDSGCAWDRMVH